MKFSIVGRDRKVAAEYRKILIRDHNAYDAKKPDIVLSLGGDGTLLLAERLYPSVPKIPIRHDSICVKCDWNSLLPILKKLEKRKYRIIKFSKFVASVKGKKLLCVNDFIFRNRKPYEAVRFEIRFGGQKTNLIGDGVTIATPFGSSGYFWSITKKKFKKGIGIAFNNVRKNLRYKIIPENSRIRIKIVRGEATFTHDNAPDIIAMKEGDSVEIRKSSHTASIIKIS
jgi:NAD+ kinase